MSGCRAGWVRVAAGGVRVVCGWCAGGERVASGLCAGCVRVAFGWRAVYEKLYIGIWNSGLNWWSRGGTRGPL